MKTLLAFKKMRKRILLGGSILAIGIISIFCYNNNRIKSENNSILASIDKYMIKERDVDNIFNQFGDEPEHSKTEILEDLIDQMVAVSMAESLEIVISESDISSAIEEYKETFSDVYAQSVEIYGEDTFKNDFRDQHIYEQVYKKITDEALVNNRKAEIYKFREYLKEQDILMEVSALSDSTLFVDYATELKNYIFNNWVRQQRNNVKIVYY